MSEATDLHARVAQRLFGWTWGRCHARCPYAQEGWHTAAGAHVWHLPAYSTDPAATAQVWQWLERQDGPLCQIRFLYGDNVEIDCLVSHGGSEVVGWGTTWPEALCTAALALAEALEQGKEGG